jgi:DegV family protein with EDD domain
MGEVSVITDSSSCLPSSLCEEFGVTVLPISVHDGLLDETAVEPGTDWRLPASVELEELETANHPFVTEYLAAIESRADTAAVIVTPAIEFATMYRNAALAVELADRPAVVVDSRTAAAGQALVVLAGAAAARSGGSVDDVVAAITDAAHRVELVASLATLEPIRQNGPISGDVLGIGELDGARSVFRMREGNVEPLGDPMATDATLERITEFLRTSAPRGVERSTVFHAGVPDLACRLARLLGGVDFVSGFSLAMQVHTGRGVVGAAWLPR